MADIVEELNEGISEGINHLYIPLNGITNLYLSLRL